MNSKKLFKTDDFLKMKVLIVNAIDNVLPDIGVIENNVAESLKVLGGWLLQ